MGNALASSFSNLLASTIGSVCSCISEEGKYIRNLSANLDALDKALGRLRALREHVKMKVTSENEENPNMQPTEVVNLWFRNVDQVDSKAADQLKDKDLEVKRLCLLGFCSKNLKSSYLFGKAVEDLLKEVIALEDQGKAFKEVTVEVTPAAREEPMDQRIIVGQESMLDEVWRYLGKENCGMIGLYGMPGVGKTTLLKQINNRFCKEPLGFRVIIMVVVSSKPNYDKIRKEIAERIGLSGDHKNKGEDVSNTLCKKKFVLLLDDIWDEIDLPQLGVPLQRLKSGSKILFTTRKSDVCSKMGADEKVEVKCLSFTQASELFQQKVGKVTLERDPRIPKLADEVVKECACLPLALITVGRVMAGKDTPSEWEQAIRVLRTSAAEFEDMEEKVFCRLKFSYDSLSNDTTRSCLLYCRLYPEDYKISIRLLIDCWIGEGFLSEYTDGGIIISNLVRACLLEKEDDDEVKMHDVIRDMALWIACGSEKEKENCLVEAGNWITEAPKVGKWEGIKRMSLMRNNIKSLPTFAANLDLQTLFLNDNWSVHIPRDDFFQFMPSLKVLDLTASISLGQGRPEICKLVQLQHLDLSGTEISGLPKELSALVNLRCLKLEHAKYLRTIPRKLISEFIQLKVFRIINCCVFDLSRDQDSVLCGGYELLVEELCGLKCLTALSIELKSSQAFQRFLTSPVLKSCTQTLRCQLFRDLTLVDVSFLKDMKNLSELFINDCDFEELKIDSAYTWLTETQGFYSIHTLEIFDCKNLRDLTWLILAPSLKKIEIRSCASMEEIISDEKWNEVQKNAGILNPFAKLQRLDLLKLPNLKKICQNALPFPHLEFMRVHRCPRLKELPLDSNSAKDRQVVILGEEYWWKNLQWRDEATKNAFLPCFKVSLTM